MSDIRFNRWLHQSGTGGVSQDSSGNIGIGTTVPTKALDVVGDVKIGDTISIENTSGIITATTFSGVSADFSGNVSIAGTLTYEDVTNIDSVGVVTARSDVHIGAGLSVVGVSTLGNTIVGGATTELIVGGDARITGILTIGTSSLTLDGTNNLITVGSGVTINGNTGIISATGGLNAKLLGTPELAAIDSSITDTAVDVFVYDTRKDSDGGAWRKRTQHTSWYNETLNTATRGSRKEFPAVAVIVATATGVTIYDGDDPDMPMWMVFNSPRPSSNNGEQTMLGCNGDTPSSCSALNGNISVGEKLSYGGLVEILFVSDTARRRRGSYGGNGTHGYWVSKSISTRNTGNTGTGRGYDDSLGSSTERIVTDNVNDVAMTVLPNALIDSATGLPVPTIAVGTDGGVSVIKDDGTVVDLTRSSGSQNTSYVDFNGDKLIIQNSSTTGTYYNVAIPSSDTANDDYNGNVFWVGGTPASRIQYGASKILSKKSYELVRSYNVGFDILRDYNLTTNGLVAYATTSYNTGWLHGSVKGAFLSDTDATNNSTEYLTNGGFDTDITGWTGDAYTTTSVTSGVVHIEQNSGTTAGISQAVTTVIGKKYVISGRIKTRTGSSYGGGFYVGTSHKDNNIGFIRTYQSQGSFSFIGFSFVATSTTTYITLVSWGATGDWVEFEYVSLRDAEEDRSVNGAPVNNSVGKDLVPFGTITKSAVATGAELVAYSNFNTTSNYLEQPYNSSLTFGTNDFSVMCWYYNDTSTEIRVQRTTGGADGWALTLGNAGEDFYIHNGNFSTFVGFTDLTKVGSWTHFTVVRRYGDKWYVYKNGELAVSTTTLASNNFNDTGTFKVHAPSGSSANSIALLRVSQSVPSPEQIKKIYEDEKVLFQENAACTLYGSSDAVTALAYDDSTNLLYAGTSSGRSDFQGLRRINNTTTAVTTAISASNGLVAEQ